MSTGKITSKIFFTFVVTLILTLVSPGVATAAVQEDGTPTGVEINGQEEISYKDVDSREVDYVLESPIATKMTRAEKEQNAKTYDSYGGGISIIAMCIVVSALAVLSVLFLIFGKISSSVIKKKKKESAAKTSKSKGAETKDEDHSLDSGETIAAIAAALAQHFDRNHDIENTILTIHKMRKAYSPWNSKIYNMRHVPEHTHNNPKIRKN